MLFAFLSTKILGNGQLALAGKSSCKMASGFVPGNLNYLMSVNMDSGKWKIRAAWPLVVNWMGNLREFLQERMRKFGAFCALLGVAVGWRTESSNTDSELSTYSEKNKSQTVLMGHWFLQSSMRNSGLRMWCSTLHKEVEWRQISYLQPVVLVFEEGIIIGFFWFRWTGPFHKYYSAVFGYYFNKRQTKWDRVLTYCPAESKSSEMLQSVLDLNLLLHSLKKYLWNRSIVFF